MHYFDRKLSRGFVALFSGKAIMNVASGLFTLFLPIFLYKVFQEKIEPVAVYYLLGSLIYIFALPLTARYLNKFGFRRALKMSAIFGAAYYAGLCVLNEENWRYVIPVVLTLITLWRLAHWVPYHVDFAKFTDRADRGRELSALQSFLSLIGIFTPLAAGFIISQFGFNVLFLIGVVLFFAALFPYMHLPHTKEKFSWGYKQTWKKFFSRKHRRTVLVYAIDGVESATGVLVWPIFIFVLFNGNYLEVGFISTLIAAATIVLQLIVGKKIDKKIKERKKMLKYGSFLYAFGWIFKIFIFSALHVFVIDVYHKLTKIFTRTPFDVLTYEIAADQGHYVDEYTVLHEMAIGLGKALMFLLVIVLIQVISLNWVFLVAALTSLGFSFIRAERKMTRKNC